MGERDMGKEKKFRKGEDYLKKNHRLTGYFL